MFQQLNWKYKIFIAVSFILAHTVLYTFPNVRPIFEPLYLPLWKIDRMTPLIPWTFVVYLSDYLLGLCLLFMHKDLENFNSLARVCFGVLFLSGLCFLFFPTTYPRPEYPEVEKGLVWFTMWLVSSADTPHNCFPSIHVALTAAGAWSTRHMGKTVSGLFWVWAVAIFVSTMTTKQHYFADILGGLGVVSAMVALEWAVFQKRYLSFFFARAER